MQDTKEINALFQLLDDPDNEVFEMVSNKIIHFGKDIIPNLEKFWENNIDNTVQERIETIIHKVNFNDSYQKIKTWALSKDPTLIDGAFLMSQYRFPYLKEITFHNNLHKLYKECWLEINPYLTALEQVTIINSVIFSLNKFQGNPLEINTPNHFFVSEVLESKKGNAFSLGIIYQILCDMLDVPVFAIKLPGQNILAYIENYTDYIFSDKLIKPKIQFYIDPNTGEMYSQNDINVYLKKYNFKVDENAFLPYDPQEIIFNTLAPLQLIYQELNKNLEADDINTLLEIKESN